MAAFGSVRSGSADRRRAGSGDRCAAAGREARYKRPFDLAVLALGLIVLLPVWPVALGAIALAIRLSGPSPVLFLGRYERLDADWRTVCERLGLPFRALPRLNPRPEGCEAARPDADTAALLRRRYAEDFRLGGYGGDYPGGQA